MAREPELERTPEAGIVATALADLRATPDHRAELVSQLLFGETIEGLERTDDGRWLRVRGEDGYAGWTRAWSIDARTQAEAAAWRARARFRVTAPWLWRKDGGGPVPYGACLAEADDGAGFVGPEGRLELAPRDRRAVRAAPSLEPGGPAKRGSVVRAARGFLGVPYLWGGRSPAGLDCSALVQLAYASVGIRLPRDARDQCAALGGRERLLRPGRAKPRPGDLLFFATGERPVTHVALAVGPLEVLHAYGRVELGSLDAAALSYVPELARTWLGFARAPLHGSPEPVAGGPPLPA